MRREEKYLSSHRPYAVDLDSLDVTESHTNEGERSVWVRATINAVWFRRRQGRLMACMGSLWDYQKGWPASGTEFLTRHEDGRYGGQCAARWDGEDFWTTVGDPAIIHEQLNLLRPMLADYPQVPEGFDGWWTFL